MQRRLTYRTKALAVATLVLTLLGVLLLELGAPSAEAQEPAVASELVLADGDPDGVTLRFRWSTASCGSHCNSPHGYYRYMKVGDTDWAYTHPGFHTDSQESLPNSLGYYAIRITGLTADTEYKFEVWYQAQNSDGEVRTYARGSDTAWTRTPTTPITSVPNLRSQQSSGRGGWKVSWSDPSACSQACTVFEVAYRLIGDSDEPKNWFALRDLIGSGNAQPFRFDSAQRLLGTSFLNQVVVEVSYWKVKTLVARSRITVTPRDLLPITVTASGPDITSRGAALRQVGLSWTNPLTACAPLSCARVKYRLRYAEGAVNGNGADWSNWTEAGAWSQSATEQLAQPLALPEEDTEYTIEVQFYLEKSSGSVVRGRGWTRVHTYANYAPTFDNLPRTLYIRPNAKSNPNIHTIVATDRNQDGLRFSAEGTWDDHFEVDNKGVVSYVRDDEDLKVGTRYDLMVKVTEVGRDGLNNDALLRVIVGSPPAPDSGPIPHAIWCDVVDGEGVCLTAGGGKIRPPYTRSAVQIANGAFHHCALDAEGRGRCWGDDAYGQVSGLPREQQFKYLGAGWTFSCGLTDSGDVKCWGYNGAGQLNVPAPGSGPYVQLSVGNDFACALDAENRTVCWGANGFGQLDLPEGVRFLHLAAGGYHACGITTADETVCWGLRSEALRSTGALDVPKRMRFTNLAALRYQTCGRTTEGEIVCWGAGRFSSNHYPWALNGPSQRWAEAGAPTAITLELELSIYAGGLLEGGPFLGDQFQLAFIATVLDAEGRPARDGTPVIWNIPTETKPELLVLGQDRVTAGGRATARFVLLGPEPFQVTLSAGEVSAAMAFPPPVESVAVRWAGQE